MILESRTVRLRLVEEVDAKFILKLRLDKKYNQFLSSVSPDLQSQKDWIRNYKNDEEIKKQFYFIIERMDGVPCGTVRVYDLKNDSFCWGSWILNEDKTHYAALESAFLVYKFGFKILGYKKSHFDVMKENKKVISFHTKMGAKEVGTDEQNLYFEITDHAVYDIQDRLAEKLQ